MLPKNKKLIDDVALGKTNVVPRTNKNCCLNGISYFVKIGMSSCMAGHSASAKSFRVIF
jgi:hypothetical protein